MRLVVTGAGGGLGRAFLAQVPGHHEVHAFDHAGLDVGDLVVVTGANGATPTQWNGTVTADNGDGTYDVNDLHVRRVQQGLSPTAGTGSEDVSVTVTNDTGTDTSNTLPSQGVPTVP